jgi:hypothetical protein
LNALEAEVTRLNGVVGVLAAQPRTASSSTPTTPVEPQRIPPPIPGEITQEELATQFEASPANVQKTRALSASLDERFKKDTFATSQIKVDEVDCRGDACRVRMSYAETAAPEPMLLELASALPDSHSFQEFASAGNGRRTVTSHYIDESGKAKALPARTP